MAEAQFLANILEGTRWARDQLMCHKEFLEIQKAAIEQQILETDSTLLTVQNAIWCAKERRDAVMGKSQAKGQQYGKAQKGAHRRKQHGKGQQIWELY